MDLGERKEHYLCTPRENLNRPSHLFFSTDHRIQLALFGELSQIGGVFLQMSTHRLGYSNKTSEAHKQSSKKCWVAVRVGADTHKRVEDRNLTCLSDISNKNIQISEKWQVKHLSDLHLHTPSGATHGSCCFPMLPMGTPFPKARLAEKLGRNGRARAKPLEREVSDEKAHLGALAANVENRA